ncbi:HK97 family phage prohead protease [Salinarimonas ramus]|uniref:Primosomal replication protein N n=1 Tax=Salinarimonas ramus TaxID=690164 RepID=A0A917Q6Y4_9HYPH|nr:HK97 family phage prohead protease [Salinarimonas ramus]GGK29867.1 primosomal replication protein N [Salinarimonas ramus]
MSGLATRRTALAKGAAGGAPETKLLPAKPDIVDASGVFEGYASLFGVTDLAKDVVQPGAFAKSLATRGARGVRMLFQHDPGEPIGTWLKIEEDACGLRVRGRLNLAVGRAREIHALMREGAIDGLSIGYRVTKAGAERASGRRLLHEVDLWEISIVTFPMLPAARVAAVKGVPPSLAETIRKAAKKLLPGAVPAAA